MLEIIANIGKLFAQPFFWGLVGIIGFCTINRAMFGRALLLVLFTMIYNTLLKSIWQEPLPPPMEGWAFPSGHMHSAMVFWGWLAVEYRKVWFQALITFMLCLAGYSMLYHGYHYPRDVLGAVGFGALSITLYFLLQRLWFFKDKPYRLGFVLIPLCVICIAFMLPEARKPHIWQGLGAMIGLTAGWMLLAFSQKPNPETIKACILQVVITLTGAGLLIFGIGKLSLALPVMLFVKFLAVGLWVPLSVRFRPL